MSTIKVTLSDRHPVTIDVDEWPVIARADDHDGQIKAQANNLWSIIVREHSDGRRLVYAIHQAGNGGQFAGFREKRGGFLLPARGSANEREHVEETIRSIRRVAGIIDRDDLGDECIGDLPPEKI